jgi:hypothetical protein
VKKGEGRGVRNRRKVKARRERGKGGKGRVDKNDSVQCEQTVWSVTLGVWRTCAGTPILFKVAATMRTDILSPYDTKVSLVRGVSSPIYLMPERWGGGGGGRWREGKEKDEMQRENVDERRRGNERLSISITKNRSEKRVTFR